MPLPAELKPQSKSRIMDLVQQAGLDVADWPNYANGSSNPGANPKYCYEWALKEPGKLVVCNLWYRNMVETRDGAVEQRLMLRDSGDNKETNATRRERRSRMASLLSDAFRESLPVRVIVLDGQTRYETTDSKAKIKARALDPVAWAVTSIDASTGAVTLRRGVAPQRYSDQFSLPTPADGDATQRTATVTMRNRSTAVRLHVLCRAKGKCEYCNEAGFQLADGSVFLETHHIIPLSENGADSVENVVALCPNHHREAHYGQNAIAMRETLLANVRST